MSDAEHQRRFVATGAISYLSAIQSAETYVSRLTDDERRWLRYKPYDQNHGHPQYFRLMHDFLNVLQALEVPAGGRILEVGCGSGWITETLVMLGYRVDALDASADMIAVARARCACLPSHFGRLDATTEPIFHHATMEQIDLEDGSFDAVLFYDSLHHVVDEVVAMGKSFRCLKGGGSLGIVEGAWTPGSADMAAELNAEMARFSTLESPLTCEYLDALLGGLGFVEIRRHVAVNGFFTASELARPLGQFTSGNLAGSNNVTARKRDEGELRFPGCADPAHQTSARIDVLSGGIDRVTRAVALSLQVTNTGETRLENRASRTHRVTVALRQGAPGSSAFRECPTRHALGAALLPGESVHMAVRFTLPTDATLEGWELDLVAEGAFWFSTRQVPSTPVSCL